MIKLKQLLLELLEKGRGIWYHGTSSDKIPSILSNGLTPTVQSKRKSWDTDPDTSVNSVDRSSVGGVYVTKNLSISITSAWRTAKKFKSNKVIVIMELQPRSLVCDEDTFTSLASPKHYPISYFIYLYMFETYGIPSNSFDFKEMETKFKDKWCEDALRSIFLGYENPPEALKSTVYKYLYDVGYKAMLTRIVSYLDMNDYYSRDKWDAAYLEMNGLLKAKKDKIPNPPTPQQGELVFKSFIDKLTKTMKNRITSADDFIKTARSEEPIKFNGSNKIIAIVELIPSESSKFKEDLKIVY